MILLNVQYDCDGGIKGQKRVIILARLHDYRVSRADPVTGLQERQSAAYHDGGIFLGSHEDMRTHRGRRSFSVRTGNAQGISVSLHDSAPGLSTLENRYAHFVRAHDLRVIVMRRRRADDKVDAVRYIGSIVADEYLYPLLAQMRGALALGNVRAAYYKSRVGEHLCQRRH